MHVPVCIVVLCSILQNIQHVNCRVSFMVQRITSIAPFMLSLIIFVHMLVCKVLNGFTVFAL